MESIGGAGDFSDHADHSTRGNAVFSKETVGIEKRRFGFDVEVIAAVVFDEFDRDEDDAEEVESGGGVVEEAVGRVGVMTMG